MFLNSGQILGLSPLLVWPDNKVHLTSADLLMAIVRKVRNVSPSNLLISKTHNPPNLGYSLLIALAQTSPVAFSVSTKNQGSQLHSYIERVSI